MCKKKKEILYTMCVYIYISKIFLRNFKAQLSYGVFVRSENLPTEDRLFLKYFITLTTYCDT